VLQGFVRKSGQYCFSRAGFLVHHEEHEVHEGFSFFLILYFPLLFAAEEKTVSVLAICVKEGNRLFIGGQEFEI
jgi:hypothetical protein